MAKKMMIVALVVAVLVMTGCDWDAFGAGMAAGYYGPSYQPVQHYQHHDGHGYYYPWGPYSPAYSPTKGYFWPDADHHEHHHGYGCGH